MQTGVYRKIKGHTGVGMFYLVLFPMRHHVTGEESIAYVPLRVEPEWHGTLRVCYYERDKFNEKFVYVAEGLPDSDAILKSLEKLQTQGDPPPDSKEDLEAHPWKKSEKRKRRWYWVLRLFKE